MTGIYWRLSARCRDFDSEIFFPISHGTERLIQVETAKGICSTCPVKQTCGDWALDNGEAYGVWGGMDEEERRALGLKRAAFGRRRPVARLHCRNGHDLTLPDAIFLNARNERCCVRCKEQRHAAALAEAVAA